MYKLFDFDDIIKLEISTDERIVKLLKNCYMQDLFSYDVYCLLRDLLKEEDNQYFFAIVFFALYNQKKITNFLSLDKSYIKELELFFSEDQSSIKEYIFSLKTHQYYEIYDNKLFFKIDFLNQERIFELLKFHKSNKVVCKKLLNDVFEKQKYQLNKEQKQAVKKGVLQDLSFIMGGAGTGKTSIITCLIHAFINLEIDLASISLVAPTARAAKYMQEKVVDMAVFDKELLVKLKAETLHRFLAFNAKTNKFYYNEANQHPAKIIIVDEVSMIGQTLMQNFLLSTKESKIIFLGDYNQLEPVDDSICLPNIILNNNATFQENICFLKESYRANKTLLNLCNSIINHSLNKENAIKLLEDNQIVLQEELFLKEGFFFLDQTNSLENVLEVFLASFIQAMKKYSNVINLLDEQLDELFLLLDEFKILTMYKQIKDGSDDINKIIFNLISKTAVNFPTPIILTKNYYNKQLFNGELGWLCRDNTKIKLYFKNNDSYECYQDVFSYDMAYCLTVHKSQGSEYGHVLFYLPNLDKDKFSLNMLYTAFSRAKNTVHLLSDKEVFSSFFSNK